MFTLPNEKCLDTAVAFNLIAFICILIMASWAANRTIDHISTPVCDPSGPGRLEQATAHVEDRHFTRFVVLVINHL